MQQKQKPFIAVMSQISADDKGKLYPCATFEIDKMMNSMDVDWLIIPPNNEQNAHRLFELADGLIVCGTFLPAPVYYKTDDISIENISRKAQPLCDKISMSLFEQAKETNLPVLGICHGMQLMNLACGGTWRHIEGHNVDGDWDTRAHEMCISPEFADVIDYDGELLVSVNSKHSLCCGKLGCDLKLAGFGYEDGGLCVPEMIWNPTQSFFVGVQWHPEFLLEDELSCCILKSFEKSAASQ